MLGDESPFPLGISVLIQPNIGFVRKDNDSTRAPIARLESLDEPNPPWPLSGHERFNDVAKSELVGCVVGVDEVAVVNHDDECLDATLVHVA